MHTAGLETSTAYYIYVPVPDELQGLIYGLFSDAVNNTESVVSNMTVVSDEWI